MGNLAWNEANAEKLYRAGACEAVVDVLGGFGKTHKGVAEHGCQAVAYLAAKNRDSKSRLNALDAWKIVCACVKTGYQREAVEELM